MGTFQVGLLLIGTFALLLALSVPVSVSIIISSVVTMASTLSLDLGTFVASQRMVGGVDSFSLLAVPFYILCGVLMNTGGIAQKLIDFAKILVGRIPGGLAHTNAVRLSVRFLRCSFRCYRRRSDPHGGEGRLR